MKNSVKLLLVSFVTLGLFLACYKADIVKDKTQLTITEDGDKHYKLSANYSAYKVIKVQEVVNESAAPVIIFKSVDDDLQGNYLLKDGTKFYLKSEKGHLEIQFDKTKNSEASYQKVKKLYLAISMALK